MKILVIQNTYQQHGGEHVAAQQEAHILNAHGHTVIQYTRSNAELNALSLAGKLTMPLRMTWAQDTVRDLRALIEQHRPDVAHIHNTHFMVSPSAVHVCAEMGVPVVKTLHNFRLVCPAATLFRDGHICEDCLAKPVPLAGVVHGCFRGSRAQSAALAFSNGVHHYRGTWGLVSRFITPTEFVRQKMIQAGFDAQRISHKPHFLAVDPALTPPDPNAPRYLLYVGRLSPEKGTGVMLDAWRQLPDIPLKIIGDGPLMPQAQAALAENPTLQIELLGRRTPDEVNALMRNAAALVFPSECYETFGMVAVEAFAVGTPVIASGHGAPAELITHGHDGLHFTPGDASALAAQVRALWGSATYAEMRHAARQTFLAHYTAETNYAQLMAIYAQALQARTEPQHV